MNDYICGCVTWSLWSLGDNTNPVITVKTTKNMGANDARVHHFPRPVYCALPTTSWIPSAILKLHNQLSIMSHVEELTFSTYTAEGPYVSQLVTSPLLPTFNPPSL